MDKDLDRAMLLSEADSLAERNGGYPWGLANIKNLPNSGLVDVIEELQKSLGDEMDGPAPGG